LEIVGTDGGTLILLEVLILVVDGVVLELAVLVGLELAVLVGLELVRVLVVLELVRVLVVLVGLELVGVLAVDGVALELV